MLKLGGLRRELPIVFLCFVAGASALASVPLVTAGFFSKGWILEALWSAGQGQRVFWALALAGAFVTAFYAFRMVGLVFFGRAQSAVHHPPGLAILFPLVVLASGAILTGFLRTPPYLGGIVLFDRALETAFHEAHEEHAAILPEIIVSAAVLAGAALSLFLYRRGRETGPMEAPAEALRRSPAAALRLDALYRLLVVRPYEWLGSVQKRDWVNLLYDYLFVRPYEWAASILKRDWVNALFEYLLVRPYRWITTVNRRDVADLAVRGIALVNVGMHRAFAAAQTGKLRWYLLGVAAGGALIFGLEVLL
jgi:NADH-quinone oxidoreductase subunit L